MLATVTDPDRPAYRASVSFIGDVLDLGSVGDLTFGRSADIELDTNPALPPVVGRFHSRDGAWWLSNMGASLAIVMSERDGESFAQIAPGSAAPLFFRDSLVRVVAGVAEYELEVFVDVPPAVATSGRARRHVGDDRARRSGRSVSINADQRMLLTALAENKLRCPERELEIPSNAKTAARLDWTITKFNRKLDHLCAKFANLGVAGLRGSAGQLATDRRRRLVEHCLADEIVTSNDLSLLEPVLAASEVA